MKYICVNNFMLRNISYNNQKIKREIEATVGSSFNIFERIKMKGIGSSNMEIIDCNKEIQNLLNLDNNSNKCNIEIRKKGIIIFFRVLLETYGLVIPFFKLKIFKGESNVYSLYMDKYFIKVLVKNKTNHNFFKKILKQRVSN